MSRGERSSTFEQRADAVRWNREAAALENARAASEPDPARAASSRALARLFAGNADYLERVSRDLADG